MQNFLIDLHLDVQLPNPRTLTQLGRRGLAKRLMKVSYILSLWKESFRWKTSKRYVGIIYLFSVTIFCLQKNIYALSSINNMKGKKEKRQVIPQTYKWLSYWKANLLSNNIFRLVHGSVLQIIKVHNPILFETLQRN